MFGEDMDKSLRLNFLATLYTPTISYRDPQCDYSFSAATRMQLATISS